MTRWLHGASVAVLIVAVAGGCSADPEEPSSPRNSVIVDSGDSGLDMEIQSYRDVTLLCYALSTVSGVEVASGCPLRQDTKDAAVFAASGPVAGSWFAVLWIAEGVEVIKASAPFDRHSAGWVVLESSDTGFFWVDLGNLEAEFHCSVEFSSLDCAMTKAPHSITS